jgi:hypothetical protein
MAPPFRSGVALPSPLRGEAKQSTVQLPQTHDIRMDPPRARRALETAPYTNVVVNAETDRLVERWIASLR